MKEVSLSNGQVALVDDEDFDLVGSYKWHAKPQGRTTYAFAHAGERRRYGHRSSKLPVKMHRMILGLKTGDGTLVDHVNGNGLDNRRSNLRLANKSLNAANGFRSRKGRTGFKGTYLETRFPGLKKPWMARISANGKTLHLGSFATEEEAARRYDEEAKKLFGPYAHPNFP